MKNLKDIIIEKFMITANTHQIPVEELRDDYDGVENCLTKAEKQVYAKKYGVKSNKYADIQAVIALKLREQRKKKTKFDDADRLDFYHLKFKDKELYDYLDQEPIDFVKYLFEYDENRAKKRNLLQYLYLIHMRGYNYKISYADKSLLLEYEKLQKYLANKGKI